MQLKVQDIRKSFGSREILHGISFTVESGRAMGFLGRNGAGKSTTIRCLMDVFKQDSGRFLLDGEPFDVNRYRVGYLPEERGMYGKIKVLDQLVYFARLRGANKASALASAKEWINYFGLNDYMISPLEQLSKGNQQKIQIAQAFVNDPDILILDEPFSGLDPVNAGVFKKAVQQFVKKGKLVIFSSHQMGYVEEICDDVTIINGGEILLTGDLGAIRRERGENKYLLKVAKEHQQAAMDAFQQAFPASVLTEHEKGLIIDSRGSAGQKEMLLFLAEQPWPVERFGLYEPDLNDIFVSLTGGEKA